MRVSYYIGNKLYACGELARIPSVGEEICFVHSSTEETIFKIADIRTYVYKHQGSVAEYGNPELYILLRPFPG